MPYDSIIAQVTRGGLVESQHSGAWVVSDAKGHILSSGGDFEQPVFPRSAIKAFQCLPVIESGAALRFGFTDEEIALACASHHGEEAHVHVVRAMLEKAGVSENHLACGAHWPLGEAARIVLARSGAEPGPLHNNCSGKHAAMLAQARHLRVPLTGYTDASHVVQQQVAAALAQLCGIDPASCPMGIDGCSIPTWAFPLTALARGFARLAQCDAGQRIVRSVRRHPIMIGGTNAFDTRIMQQVPRLFIKVGAEGVHAGVIPHVGLGFALKCRDGASRASEVAAAGLLASLKVWDAGEKSSLEDFAHRRLSNWQHVAVGDIHACCNRS